MPAFTIKGTCPADQVMELLDLLNEWQKANPENHCSAVFDLPNLSAKPVVSETKFTWHRD